MKILPDPIEFEWDEGNIDKSIIKHDVSNQEAEEVFNNEPKYILKSRRSSITEKRYMLWGATNKDRQLTVIFTLRNSRIRVVSARPISRKERRNYEQKIKTDTKI